MSYRKDYLQSHNVDWFACVNGIWIHSASRGGLLPSKVDNEVVLPRLQGICSNLPDICDRKDILINDDLLEERYRRALDIYAHYYGDNTEFQGHDEALDHNEFLSQYSELFVDMAVKGFYSFVRVDIDDDYSNEYRLVAYPPKIENNKLDSLIRHPFDEAFGEDEEMSEYLRNVSIQSNEPIDFQSNLDFIFDSY